jgi:hypothetical protein
MGHWEMLRRTNIFLLRVAGSNPAGIAATYADEIRVSCSFDFVLSPEPCCDGLQAGVSNSKVLPPPTNGSTPHQRNTAFPASFASDLDTDTIGIIALVAAVTAVFIAAKLSRCRKCPPE